MALGMADAGITQANRAKGARWPLPAAFALFSILVVLALVPAWRHTKGISLYSLDDAYIHLATAKNLAQHGVWGITRYEFSSACSSLLWPLLLAGAFLLFGPITAMAAILNVILGALLIIAANMYLRSRANPWQTFALLTLLVVATPVIPVVFTGMEHVLQAVLLVGFLAGIGRYASDNSPPWLFLACIAGLAATRYETAFMVGIAAFAVLNRGRIIRALGLIAAVLVPMTAYGLVSRHFGGHFFPNSILVKSPFLAMQADAIVDKMFDHFEPSLQTAHIWGLLILCIAAQLCLNPAERADSDDGLQNSIILLTVFVHLLMWRNDWFFRYESYLFLLCVLVPARIVLVRLRGLRLVSRWTLGSLAFAGMIPYSVGRCIQAQDLTPRAINNIYDQQVQMAAFVRENYRGRTIALNDIGAVSFFADVHIVDMAALATQEVTDRALERPCTPSFFRKMMIRRGAVAALLYTSWFPGLPGQWQRVGNLHTPDNVVCGDEDVAFFALADGQAPILAYQIVEFQKELPPGPKINLGSFSP